MSKLIKAFQIWSLRQQLAGISKRINQANKHKRAIDTHIEMLEHQRNLVLREISYIERPVPVTQA